jgi:hypothetical protein
MKRLTLIFLFITPFIYGQNKLEGTFYTGPFDNYTLTFNKNGSVKYSLSGCTRGERDSGTYKLKKDKLFLNFIGNLGQKNSYSLKNYTDCNMDSIGADLFFKVIDKPTNEPLSDCNIVLFSSKKQIAILRTDENGFARFTHIQPIKELEIKVAYVFYTPLVFKINPGKICKGVTISMDNRSHNDLENNGKPFDYKIVKTDTSTKLILIKGYGGSDLVFKKE